MGTADELEQFADQLRAIEKKMIGFYTKALSIEEQAIMPLLKNETWLTGKQLTALGFTTTPQQVKAAAKAFLKPKTTPMNGSFTDKDRHWMESLFEKVLGKFKHNNMFNKVIQDATGAELDFTELAGDAVIEIGAKEQMELSIKNHFNSMFIVDRSYTGSSQWFTTLNTKYPDAKKYFRVIAIAPGGFFAECILTEEGGPGIGKWLIISNGSGGEITAN